MIDLVDILFRLTLTKRGLLENYFDIETFNLKEG